MSDVVNSTIASVNYAQDAREIIAKLEKKFPSIGFSRALSNSSALDDVSTEGDSGDEIAPRPVTKKRRRGRRLTPKSKKQRRQERQERALSPKTRKCYNCLHEFPIDKVKLCFQFCMDCCHASDFGADTDCPDEWRAHYYCGRCMTYTPCGDVYCPKFGRGHI